MDMCMMTAIGLKEQIEVAAATSNPAHTFSLLYLSTTHEIMGLSFNPMPHSDVNSNMEL